MKLLLSILIFSSLAFGQVKFVAVSTTGSVQIFDTQLQLETRIATSDKVYRVDFDATVIEQGTVNIVTTVIFPSGPSASLDCTVICKSQNDITILGDACLCFQKIQPALFAWSLLSFPVLP